MMRGIVWMPLVVSCHTLRIAAPPLALRAGRSTMLLPEKPEAEADLAAAFAARLERLEDSAREEETQLRDQRDAELRAAGVSRARQAWGYTTEGPEPEAAVELSGLAAGALFLLGPLIFFALGSGLLSPSPDAGLLQRTDVAPEVPLTRAERAQLEQEAARCETRGVAGVDACLEELLQERARGAGR
mmetsp:Transcript_16769/g.53981  ORF Transcript_16769/g.53981 Transcript_16769/m.53981 type:complete len:187 (-) Transcript_16769:14-574(-)